MTPPLDLDSIEQRAHSRQETFGTMIGYVVDLIAEIRRLRAELEQHTALDLGAPDGRVSASCDNSEHPTWLRKPDDTRGCPWCELEPYESMSGQACESGVHPDWLANIDEQLACPWCLIAQQRYIIAALRQAANGPT